MPDSPDLIPIVIDDEEVHVPKGTNLIEAAALVGKEIPHYCYHPKLSVVGNCRMCLIELGMPMKDRATGEAILDDNGVQKIGWMPKPAIACATTAAPGMHMKTNSPLVKECREGVMEFLLVNHPLDCPICDQAGECRLQEFATDYGRGFSRFVEQKNVKPKRTRLGPRVMLDDERCILCSRCIRFCQEIAHDDVLGFTDRGSYSTLTCYPGKQLENNYSLNTVDICPVGALTSTDFRFKMRVWFLKPVPSIDTESSVGANTEVWSREGKIHRITPRRNDAVNDTWMADSGRALYKQVEADNRLTHSSIEGRPCTIDEALAEAGRILQAAPVAIVASGKNSVEEQFLVKKLAQALGEAPVWLVSRTGENDGLLISEDRNPNVRGALVTGLTRELPTARLDALRAKLEGGEVGALLVVDEDLCVAGIPREFEKKVPTVYLGTHHNETCSLARVELPLPMVFEKSGTFINQQFRLQKFLRAVPPPQGARDSVALLSELLGKVTGVPPAFSNVAELWDAMRLEVPTFSGLTFADIPASGQQLDPAPWKDLPFCETRSRYFDPETYFANLPTAAPAEA